MRVLVVDAYPLNHRDADVVRVAINLLEHAGNTVEVLLLSNDEFAGFMSAAERLASETDTPLLADETKASAAAVQAADALAVLLSDHLVWPSTGLKSWLERVMVVGVAFVFDDRKTSSSGHEECAPAWCDHDVVTLLAGYCQGTRSRLSHNHAFASVELSSAMSADVRQACGWCS